MTGSNQIPRRPLPAGLAQLGRYRLLAEIARGGIGTVYAGCADGPTGFSSSSPSRPCAPTPELSGGGSWVATV
jgi:hypothetical protein